MANDRSFGESLPHDLIYSSIGTPLSSDADEKAWLKNIHRKTFHRALDKNSRYKPVDLSAVAAKRATGTSTSARPPRRLVSGCHQDANYS